MQTDFLLDIFKAALLAVDPSRAVRRTLRISGHRLFAGVDSYALEQFDRIVVVGAGKATARMALAVEEVLGDRISGGLIIVKYGHTAPLRKLVQREAAHPVPDAAGLDAAARVLDLAGNADGKTLVVCLLSGGASSLLVQPAPGISLEEKRTTTGLLLKAGASIQEVNAVRKHLSRVKGGRLAEAAYPATVLTLILSDVIGDPLDVIASGPTTPDTSTFRDAAAVIDKYGLKLLLPGSVSARIERGLQGREPETPKGAEACFTRTRNIIVGGLGQALSAARDKAGELGLFPEIVTNELQGEAREAAGRLARMAVRAAGRLQTGQKKCFLSGGETTVTVRGTGTGGRNQELALAFALAIEDQPGITLLSAGTDGTDGPTDAAGAIVDGAVVRAASAAGLDARSFLDNNDSYTFFKEFDSRKNGRTLLLTGSTGTNVMDLQIVYCEKGSGST